jgi:hypothetical protein
VLKGQPPQSAEFVREWQMSARLGEQDSARPENGTEYLVFFDEQGKVTNAMNLVFPSRKRGIGADPRDVALSTRFGILETREAILQTVERRLDQLKRYPPRPAPVQNAANVFTPEHGFKRAEVPANTPAWKVLCGGSVCYLVIPLKTRIQRLAQSRATDERPNEKNRGTERQRQGRLYLKLHGIVS